MANTTSQELIDKKKTQLSNVEAAIVKAEKAQSTSLDDGQGKQAVARANLQTLYDERDKLQLDIIELEQSSSSGFYARNI